MYKTGVTKGREVAFNFCSPFPFLEKGTEGWAQVQHGLSVHLIEQRCGIPGDGHGCALNHGAGRRARSQPLLLFPPLSLLLLEPLLGHLPPVDGSVTVGPVMTQAGGEMCHGQARLGQLSLPSLPTVPQGRIHGNPTVMPTKATDALHRHACNSSTHFGCCLCLELDEGCDCVWDCVDWGVVLAWSWYWGVVIGWLGVV